MTAVVGRVPHTMVAVSAALDAVALRVDEAGIPLEDVTSLTVSPQAWREVVAPVAVDVHLRGEQAFTALLLLLPGHTEPKPSVNGGWNWLKATASLRDGTEVRVVAEVGRVTS